MKKLSPVNPNFEKYMRLFISGCALYPMIEIVWRGWTHVSMAVAGGVSLCLINAICNGVMKRAHISLRCAAGGCIITAVEFAAGIIVNIVLKLDVWDYSRLPMNILGQVCLPFTLMWSLLSLPAMMVGRFLARR